MKCRDCHNAHGNRLGRLRAPDLSGRQLSRSESSALSSVTEQRLMRSVVAKVERAVAAATQRGSSRFDVSRVVSPSLTAEEKWGRSESLDPDNVGDIADEGAGHRG